VGTITLASDTFPSAQNPIAGNWTNCSNSGAGGLKIASAGAVETIITNSALGQGAFYNAVSFPNDQWSSIVVGAKSNGQYLGPGVRVTSTGSPGFEWDGYWFAIEGAGGAVIQRVASSGGTTIASGVSALSVGDVLTLWVVGTHLTAYHNGVSILTATDSTYTSGAAGMNMYSPTSITTNQIASWQGGEFFSGVPNSLAMMGCGT